MQELPDEAFVSSEELRAVWDEGGRGGYDEVLPVVTISFCWDTRDHPDPKARQGRNRKGMIRAIRGMIPLAPNQI